MDRERAKELLPIIQAFAEGKKVEMALFDNDGAISEWADVFFPIWSDDHIYRIKPEPKYRPFEDAEECWEEMQKHQPFGWILFLNGTDFKFRSFICSVYKGIIEVCDRPQYTFKDAFRAFTFADGNPFGKEE